MKFSLAIVLVLTFAGLGFSQSVPVIKQNGKTTTASNLRGTIKPLTCHKKSGSVEGIVVNRNFEQDETTIGSFEVRTAGGKKPKIYLNIKQTELLGDNSAILVNSLIANGRKVKVFYSECSNNTKALSFADTITAF